jgi:hypothetical protein
MPTDRTILAMLLITAIFFAALAAFFVRLILWAPDCPDRVCPLPVIGMMSGE